MQEALMNNSIYKVVRERVTSEEGDSEDSRRILDETLVQPDEQENLADKMKSFSEDQTLKTLIKYLTPWWLLGLLGLFSPLLYSILPVHEADICLCVFFKVQANSSWRLMPTLSPSDYFSLQVINLVSNYTLNYVLMFGFVLAVYKIRHVKDKTLIGTECACVVAFWFSLILPEFVMLTALFSQRCQAGGFGGDSFVLLSLIYACLIGRDLGTAGFTLYFQVKVRQSRQFEYVLTTGGHNQTFRMLDFDLMLESVLTHDQFAKFLRLHMPSHLTYLNVVRKAKLLNSTEDPILRSAILNAAKKDSRLFLDSDLMNSYRSKTLLNDTIRTQRSSTDLFKVAEMEHPETSVLENIDYLFECSYHELNFVFNNEYQVSNEFKAMVL